MVAAMPIKQTWQMHSHEKDIKHDTRIIMHTIDESQIKGY